MDIREGDIKITEDGDLDIFDEDIGVIYELDYVKQQVTNRVRTMNPDWFYDKIGSDLELILGEPNTITTAEEGLTLIRRCLTFDGFMTNEDIYIKPVPASQESIFYYLFIKTPFTKDPLKFIVDIALSAGINIKEVK